MKRYLLPFSIIALALLLTPWVVYCQKSPDPDQPKAKKVVVSSTLDRRQAGLRIYKPEKCYNGYTLIAHGACYNLIDDVEVFLIYLYLIDMEGNVVYQWMADGCPTLTRLKPNGHLFYINGAELRELDMQSNVVWSYSTCDISHAFDFMENNNFIIDRDDYFDECSRTCRDKNNKPTDRIRIEVISPDKKVLWSWKGEEHSGQIVKLSGVDADVSQENNNHCEILKETPLSRKDKRFRKGNILFSYNSNSLIGIIEYPSGEVVWAWGFNILDGQHAPTMLENGNLLIFDNGGDRGWARVIELNPLTEEITWEYHAQPKEDFYTRTGGNAQRLPNGNTLICEGWRNRIFEITAEGEVVWDFISEFNKINGQGNIYEAFRYSEEYVRPLLEARKKMLGKSKNGSGKDRNKPIRR